MTSPERWAFRVLEAIRSSRTRVVTTMSGPLGACRGLAREQLGNRRHARERPGLVPGPEEIFLAVRRDRRIHHRERAPRRDHLKAAGRETDARLARHPRLRAREERLDVAERGIEVMPLMQPVAVEPAELVLPE